MAEVSDIKAAFGVVKTEERYLRDRIDVQDAKKKLFDANFNLGSTIKSFNSTDSGTPQYQRLADQVKAAQRKVDEAKVEYDRIASLAKTDYKRLLSIVEKEKNKEEQKIVDRQLEIENNTLKRLRDSGQDVTAQQEKINDLVDKRNKTGKYAPKAEDVETTTETTATLDVTKLTQTAPLALSKMSAKQRKELSQALKDAGYRVPVSGTYNDFLRDAYIQALLDNNGRNTDLKKQQSLTEFLLDKSKEPGGAFGEKAGEKPQPGTVSISTPTEAASIINQTFRSKLGRDATPEELTKLTSRLNKEENKFSSVTRGVKKKVNGVEVIQYVGGLDRGQFLADIVEELPEYSRRKESARLLTRDDLTKTARANGLNIDRDLGSTVDDWVRRVENGEDIDIFKRDIRNIAALGLPDRVVKLMESGIDLDTIYSPYKRIMASTLELQPDSISLDDSTLRAAIGPDKEMPIYDFQRALRQDNRWQYTNQARKEVADATLQVLRDFGFQG